MRMIIKHNKLVNIKEPKTIHFDLPKDFENTIQENEISQITILMNTESSKTNEPHIFVFNLSQRLDNILLFKTCLFITRKKM